jgi:hypothetical protein
MQGEGGPGCVRIEALRCDFYSHFLPSLMSTDTGEFIDPKMFLTAQYCGHCHQEAQYESSQRQH